MYRTKEYIRESFLFPTINIQWLWLPKNQNHCWLAMQSIISGQSADRWAKHSCLSIVCSDRIDVINQKFYLHWTQSDIWFANIWYEYCEKISKDLFVFDRDLRYCNKFITLTVPYYPVKTGMPIWLHEAVFKKWWKSLILGCLFSGCNTVIKFKIYMWQSYLCYARDD